MWSLCGSKCVFRTKKKVNKKVAWKAFEKSVAFKFDEMRTDEG